MLEFILRVLVALIAAGVHTLISDWPRPERGIRFAGRWVAYTLLLVLPALLPRLLGG